MFINISNILKEMLAVFGKRDLQTYLSVDVTYKQRESCNSNYIFVGKHQYVDTKLGQC